jgi:hypothetical protein
MAPNTFETAAETAAYALGYSRGLASQGLAPLLEALEEDADAFIVLAGFPMAREIATERIRALDALLESGIGKPRAHVLDAACWCHPEVVHVEAAHDPA